MRDRGAARVVELVREVVEDDAERARGDMLGGGGGGERETRATCARDSYQSNGRPRFFFFFLEFCVQACTSHALK